MKQYFKIVFTSKRYEGLELDHPAINEVDGKVFTDLNAACSALETVYQLLLTQCHTQNTIHAWKHFALYSGDGSIDRIAAEVSEVKTTEFYQIRFKNAVWGGREFYPEDEGLAFADKKDAENCLREICTMMCVQYKPKECKADDWCFHLTGDCVTMDYIYAVIETCEILPKGIDYGLLLTERFTNNEG